MLKEGSLSLIALMSRTCTIYRRAHFAASHRYWLPELS
jgi:hypothetical protein